MCEHKSRANIISYEWHVIFYYLGYISTITVTA
jgi:hypothetical protein